MHKKYAAVIERHVCGEHKPLHMRKR